MSWWPEGLAGLARRWCFYRTCTGTWGVWRESGRWRAKTRCKCGLGSCRSCRGKWGTRIWRSGKGGPHAWPCWTCGCRLSGSAGACRTWRFFWTFYALPAAPPTWRASPTCTFCPVSRTLLWNTWSATWTSAFSPSKQRRSPDFCRNHSMSPSTLCPPLRSSPSSSPKIAIKSKNSPLPSHPQLPTNPRKHGTLKFGNYFIYPSISP